MCKADRVTFHKSLKAVEKTIAHFEEPFEFAELEDFTLNKQLHKYVSGMKGKDMHSATEDEMADNKENLHHLEAITKKSLHATIKHGKEAMALKTVLIK